MWFCHNWNTWRGTWLRRPLDNCPACSFTNPTLSGSSRVTRVYRGTLMRSLCERHLAAAGARTLARPSCRSRSRLTPPRAVPGRAILEARRSGPPDPRRGSCNWKLTAPTPNSSSRWRQKYGFTRQLPGCRLSDVTALSLFHRHVLKKVSFWCSIVSLNLCKEHLKKTIFKTPDAISLYLVSDFNETCYKYSSSEGHCLKGGRLPRIR